MICQHLIEYNGYVIYCNGGIYYLPQNPHQKFVCIGDAKAEVDKVNATMGSNLKQLMMIVNKNISNGR